MFSNWFMCNWCWTSIYFIYDGRWDVISFPKINYGLSQFCSSSLLGQSFTPSQRLYAWMHVLSLHSNPSGGSQAEKFVQMYQKLSSSCVIIYLRVFMNTELNESNIWWNSYAAIAYRNLFRPFYLGSQFFCHISTIRRYNFCTART